MASQSHQERIVVDPAILSGKPVVAGTRIPVYLILNLIANGYGFPRILAAYPLLAEADIKAALAYAGDRMRREEVRQFDLAHP